MMSAELRRTEPRIGQSAETGLDRVRDYNYRGAIRAMLEHLVGVRREYLEELALCPEGSLWKTEQNGHTCYYWAHKEGDVFIRKAISRDPGMQRQLARKAYLQKSLKLLDRNIYQLERTLRGFEPLEMGAVVSRLTKAYQDLPGEYFLYTRS